MKLVDPSFYAEYASFFCVSFKLCLSDQQKLIKYSFYDYNDHFMIQITQNWCKK